jgi:cytoskeleton protein RodZ
VTEVPTMASTEGVPLPPSTVAGVLLRVAREASGLSIDMVAQQLKLAPRQVKALEEGDYTHLPGRTFVRGFVRNYARLVHLDPERVVRALPAGASAPTLEAPTLTPTAPTMGELPTTDHTKARWARWAIPLTLAAIIAAAGVYEWMRPQGEIRVAAGSDAVVKGENPAPATPPPEVQGTSLRNPLAATSPPTEGSPVTDSSVVTAPAAPASPTPAAAPTSASTTPSPIASDAAKTSPIATGVAAAPATEQTVVFAFRKYSWTQVRDRDGRMLLSRTNPGGTAQTVSGTPPLEIVIGNASDVTVRYKGEPVDLAPHTRGNIARFTLQ